MLIVLIIEIIIVIYLLKREFGKVPSNEELQRRFGHLHYFEKDHFKPRKTADYDPKKVTKPNNISCVEIKSFGFKSPQGPKRPFPQRQLNKLSFNKDPEKYAIYWLGHSSTIIEINHFRVIIDPVLDNASPLYFGVERYTKRVIEREELPEMDYIILTHNHYDHLERKTVISFKTGHFIVPLGLGTTLEYWGIKKERITELGWGEKFIEDGIEIIGEEANHFSGRYLLDANKTLFNAYIISSGGINIFWSGDTGYSDHFKDIYNKYKINFDLIALECDAYNTGWKNSHLFPHEVIQAAKDLNAKNLFPIHWGVFDLAFHPWHESVDTIISEAILNDIKVFTPMLGEKFNTEKETKTWWR